MGAQDRILVVSSCHSPLCCRRLAMDAQLLNAERKSNTVTVRRLTAAFIVVALFGAGALASWSMQSIKPASSTAIQAFTESGEMQNRAIDVLEKHGKNATILEPTMLYYVNCILCYTCGESWRYKVAVLNRGQYGEYYAHCRDPRHMAYNDDAYVCCAR